MKNQFVVLNHKENVKKLNFSRIFFSTIFYLIVDSTM